MWDYLKYIVHLHEKDANDYNGLEDYVFSCLENNKIDWFPVGRASCVANASTVEVGCARPVARFRVRIDEDLLAQHLVE